MLHGLSLCLDHSSKEYDYIYIPIGSGAGDAYTSMGQVRGWNGAVICYQKLVNDENQTTDHWSAGGLACASGEGVLPSAMQRVNVAPMYMSFSGRGCVSAWSPAPVQREAAVSARLHA